MKRRLFWKILLAFWLTFLAITQGVWLLFEISRDRRPPPERPLAEAVAPVALAGAAELVSRSGPAGFDAFVSRLPDHQRKRLELAPGRPANPAISRAAGADAMTRAVTGPDHRQYILRYWYHVPPHPLIPLNTPPELLFVGLLGGLLFSAVLAWYLTEPINRLRLGFDRLARGDLGTRLGATVGRRRDEISDLARDFDGMAQRLELLVSERDRLLHDVSHELRSPLARLRLAIGLARQSPARIDASLDRIDREAGRLDGLVGELLALTRAAHGVSSSEEYFDPADVVRSVVEDARFEAQTSDVTIRLVEDIPEEEEQRPAIRGDAELIRRAIDNVVRNALRFSTAGGEVGVAIRLLSGERSYRIDVADRGPGVPEDETAAIFEPFVRSGDAGDGGLGLGLAIAQRALIAHGGGIEARNRDGGGLLVIMTLPVADK